MSKTTVSRAVNGSPRVAPATRARVHEAVAQLGFQVNLAARSLRTSKTGLVGFLVPVISIFGLIVEALDRELAEDGVSILLTSSRRLDPRRDVQSIETLTSRGVDALVIAPSNDRSPELREYLQNIRAPIILLGLGCEPALIAEFTDLEHEAGRIGVHRLLDAGADAIISTGTIEFTASVLEQLSALNVSVPADVSLVVYGHRAAAASHAGRLPMVAYPVDEIARASRRLLVPRLAGSTGAPRVEIVNTVFVGPPES